MGRKGRGYLKENVPGLLTKVFQICFQLFCHVVSAHNVLLLHLQRVKTMYKGVCMYKGIYRYEGMCMYKGMYIYKGMCMYKGMYMYKDVYV